MPKIGIVWVGGLSILFGQWLTLRPRWLKYVVLVYLIRRARSSVTALEKAAWILAEPQFRKAAILLSQGSSASQAAFPQMEFSIAHAVIMWKIFAPTFSAGLMCGPLDPQYFKVAVTRLVAVAVKAGRSVWPGGRCKDDGRVWRLKCVAKVDDKAD